MGKKEAQERARAKRLMDNYRLTVAQWDTVYTFQNGLCPGCGQPSVKKRPDTDHDHEDGLFRGLLCSKCNPILGKFENAYVRTGHSKAGIVTKAQLLLNLAHYLLDPPATKALGEKHYGYRGRIGTKNHRKMLKRLKKNEDLSTNR